MPQQPHEEMDNRDALANSAGTYANDPRPTSVNDTRLQPEQPADENDLPVDSGATRTAAFDQGSEPRDEHRSSQQSTDTDEPSRH